MTAFEDFVNLELPRRAAFLTVAITGYDGDPNDISAPAILDGAPVGTEYQQETPTRLWKKTDGGAWLVVATGQADIVPVVNGVYNLGSSSYKWDTLYAQTLNQEKLTVAKEQGIGTRNVVHGESAGLLVGYAYAAAAGTAYVEVLAGPYQKGITVANSIAGTSGFSTVNNAGTFANVFGSSWGYGGSATVSGAGNGGTTFGYAFADAGSVGTITNSGTALISAYVFAYDSGYSVISADRGTLLGGVKTQYGGRGKSQAVGTGITIGNVNADMPVNASVFPLYGYHGLSAYAGSISMGSVDVNNYLLSADQQAIFSGFGGFAFGKVNAFSNQAPYAFNAGYGSVRAFGSGSVAIGGTEQYSLGNPAPVHTSGNALVSAEGQGSFAQGVASQSFVFPGATPGVYNATIRTTSSAIGGHASGRALVTNATSADSLISSESFGAFAHGYAQGGTIEALFKGTVAVGTAVSGGKISAGTPIGGEGSFASGFAEGKAEINSASGLTFGRVRGMLPQPYTLSRISASGASLAGGYVQNGSIYYSEIMATGASVAVGKTSGGHMTRVRGYNGSLAAGDVLLRSVAPVPYSGYVGGYNSSIATGQISYVSGNAEIIARYGSLATGQIKENLSTEGATLSYIKARDGSVAIGLAEAYDVAHFAPRAVGSRRIKAYGKGSFAQGFAYTKFGPTAYSYAGAATYVAITAMGAGSHAAGYVLRTQNDNTDSIITATGRGAFAQGYSHLYTISATGDGSFALGATTTGDITASATNAIQFGPGTNSQTDSLKIGNAGLRFKGTVGAPTTPALGDLWVQSTTGDTRHNGAFSLGTVTNTGTNTTISTYALQGGFTAGNVRSYNGTAVSALQLSSSGGLTAGTIFADVSDGYYGGAGLLTVDGFAAGYARTEGNVDGYSTILANGNGSVAAGYCRNIALTPYTNTFSSRIHAAAPGAICLGHSTSLTDAIFTATYRSQIYASPYANGALVAGCSVNGIIEAAGTSLGSFVGGYATGTGRIQASNGRGALSFGYVRDNGVMQTTASGAVALGCVEGTSSYIRSQGVASFAWGHSEIGRNITSSGDASFAGGLAGVNNITSNASGSFAFGSATSANIEATAANAVQFGPGTNALANSMKVGQTFHFVGTVGAPASPQDGQMWFDAGFTTLYVRLAGVTRSVNVT